MSGRKDMLTQTYTPQMTIVVYKSNLGPAEYYLESHSLDDKGRLLEGKPLMQETIQSMIDLFFDENQNKLKISGMIPEELLHFKALPGGYYDMVWYRPAEMRFIHFSPLLKIKSGKTWVPPMLYVVNRKHLSVYALRSNARPKEATQLMRAPFHNVSDDGSVCLGSATVAIPKEKSYSAFMKYWEDLFWLSEFTHLNGASNPTVSNLSKVWTRFINSKCKLKWSEVKELNVTKGYTLKKFLR